MTRYVALLRGINVGGNNLIRMPALKACFEALGFDGVATYIQSGNVLFSADGDAQRIASRIERALTDTFGYPASIVLRSRKQMRDIVRRAPPGFGEVPEEFRYDVLFLKAPLTAAAALKVVLTKEGVDTVHGGPGALYYARLASRATQSHLSKVAGMPIYKSMTVRNWNTTTKLLKLLEEEPS